MVEKRNIVDPNLQPPIVECALQSSHPSGSNSLVWLEVPY